MYRFKALMKYGAAVSLVSTLAAILIANSRIKSRGILRPNDTISHVDPPFGHRASFSLPLKRIVIIGTGPTGLGAAYRLHELGILRNSTQVVILEAQGKPGGLAVSQRDENGFLWDMGGHVVFSHYKYFDNVLDTAVKSWNQHKRAAFAFMRGSSGSRKFIPYPVQENVLLLDEPEKSRIMKDLQYLIQHPVTDKPYNFDEWLLKNFGSELADFFMRKYNKKVWTVDTEEMNAVWVGERVAVPSIEKIKENFRGSLKDSEWGPNKYFRFPKYNGTGGIWQAVANLLPGAWFHFNHKVTGLDIENKTLEVSVNQNMSYALKYDVLISTAPLDLLVNMDQTKKFIKEKESARDLVYSRTHVIGVGLKGKPKDYLADKSWIYFPDSDSPFYRVTVFSKYSDHHVPDPKKHWSLMCEAAEPKSPKDKDFWTEEHIINFTVSALVEYGFVNEGQLLSVWHHRLDHGYPVPSLRRDRILRELQEWLHSHGIFSRGRFGGWKYEVGNQDHSLMQGVELVDFLIRGIPEETYPYPNLVNSMKGSNRSLGILQVDRYTQDFEIVVAHYNEDLTWLLEYANNCHIYHKGKQLVPDFRFKQWQKVRNVGRETHTYLYHIIRYYDELADVTLFLQGSRAGHEHLSYPNLTQHFDEASRKGFSARTAYRFSDWGGIKHLDKWKEELHSGKMRKGVLKIDEFYRAIFNRTTPGYVDWSSGAFFAVSRATIHKRPKEFYLKLIGFVEQHPNPEEGHYLERFWLEIFS